MNELIPLNTPNVSPLYKAIVDSVSRLDTKSILLLGGMACITTVFCVAVVSLSGSEMSLSKNGFSITQPGHSV